MKNLHYGHCLLGLALAVAVLIALGVSGGTIVVLGAALACPLMMIVMMRAMGGPQNTDHEHRDTSRPS